MSDTKATVVEREVMEFDVVVVGAGPAGLSFAIRLKQLLPNKTVCVIEKAASIGAHSLSGAVLEPGPLDELLPTWRATYPGMKIPAKEDDIRFLTRTESWRLPRWLSKLPNFLIKNSPLNNHGNFIISLGQLTPWLAQQAEGLGVDVFAGYAAAAPLYDQTHDQTHDQNGQVIGVRIGDMGLEKDGAPGANFTAGIEIRAALTVLAEGSRGSVTKQLIKQFKLDASRDAPTFGLGFKELWQLPPGRAHPGKIEHSFGWPVDASTYGGSFLYHLDQDRVYVGYVVGLNYRDPRFKPFEAFQQFKHHPHVKALLDGGEIVAAGARTICAGGWQSLPKMEMPGAMLIGCAAGTLNVPKVKGIHQAIRCGMLAAEHFAATGASVGFDAKWRASPGGQELYAVRNFKPAFKHGPFFALLTAAVDALFGGKTPWTLRNTADHTATAKLSEFESPNRDWVDRSLPPRDRVSSVFFANNSHDETQPVHLKVADTSICITQCAEEYGNPCQHFCPAHVYEMVEAEAAKRLQINAANCVHCKACDIKDPYAIITWTTPEGGSGPNYQNL
jgi:electron-transferring-flavoprotein dehydrogenase